MRLKIFGLFTALLFVAACQTAPQESAEATGEGAAASAQPAQSAAAAPAPAQPQATTQQVAGPRPGSQADLVYNVGDRIFFNFDKFDINPEARKTLEDQAAWLRKYPSVTVTIEGHCDERGTREYNLALGERRAQSVKDHLVSLGIDTARVATISYGKERTAALGHTEAAWAQNRRGVTVVN